MAHPQPKSRGPQNHRWLSLFGVCLASAVLAAYACSSSEDTSGSGAGGPGGQAAGGHGLGGNGLGGGGSAGCVANLASLALTPADSLVALDGGPAAPIAFTATGTFADTSQSPLDATRLSWSVSRADATPAGSIAAGVLTPYPSAGGTVTVTATDGCVSGSTSVRFVLDVTVGSTPDPNAWNGAPVTGGSAPVIVYPSDKTRFPRNIYRTLFQWRSQGFDTFRLTYTGPNATVTVYTDGAHGLCAAANPPAGCWEVNELAWEYIAGSNAGQTATWTVDALDSATQPPTVRRSNTVELGFSLQNVEGAIFYWSTTSAGIRRGKISKTDPEDYVVAKPVGTTYPGGETIKCVACHTVSRDGLYLAAPVSSTHTNSLWIFGVTADAPPDPLVTDIANTSGHGFATISPDDANVVAAWKGVMWMVDRATGNYIEELPLGNLVGTHPDWRPDGTELVFATGNGDSPNGAGLALIPYTNATWGAPAVLLPPPPNKSNLFPMFSPDGQWIAYTEGKGGHGDNTAQLKLIGEDGAHQIELLNANRVTNNTLTNGQYQNSQPTWAPPGDYNWVAFNSKRAYGVVRPGGTQQIWVAAIDLPKALNGQDPSFPAFRVPFQGLDENNHRAYWTLDVGQGTGGSGGAGGGGPQPCSNILTLGDPCDPVADCCETGSYCDTLDSGDTYECVSIIPN